MDYLVFYRMGTVGGNEPGTNRNITVVKPTIKLLCKGVISTKEYLWKIITGNHYTIFCVHAPEGQCIHRSVRIGRCFKFPSLPKGCYEIGPCHTKEEYRGQGIYAEVLRYITAQEQTKYFMLIRRDNQSSIRGVLKAGFEEWGYASKSKYGQWFMTEGKRLPEG